MAASTKVQLRVLSCAGPHRVRRGDLTLAGLPGVVFAPAEGAGVPVVAFGHGWLRGAHSYTRLLQHLASWGFVAAAPDTERNPIPSHRSLAADLITTLELCIDNRLGDGHVRVDPERLALTGHAMGAGAAVIAAASRPVRAVAALYPAPTAPPAVGLAPRIDTPALILGGGTDIRSIDSEAIALAHAWGGPVVLRSVDKASRTGMVAGRRLLAGFGAAPHQPHTERLTRALLVGYLRYQLLGDDDYQNFADPDVVAAHTHRVVEPESDENKPQRLSPRDMIKLVRLLRS